MAALTMSYFIGAGMPFLLVPFFIDKDADDQ